MSDPKTTTTDPLIVELTGTDTATCGSHSIKASAGKSPLNKLARALVDAGYNPLRKLQIQRGGTLCFELRELQWWADNVAVESFRSSARFIKYAPMPDAAKGSAQ